MVAWAKANDLLPETTPEDLAIIAENTVDLLGVNYYQPRRAKAKETPVETRPEGLLPEDFMMSTICLAKNESLPWLGNLRKRYL